MQVCERERRCVRVQECIITDGNFTSPSRFPARGTSLFLSSTKHRPYPGGRSHCLACPVPASGIMRMISVVHFVMLSLTYELWAIFQNFSQGGHSHLQGLGGAAAGAPGVLGDAYLPQTNLGTRRQPQEALRVARDFHCPFGSVGLERPTGSGSRQVLLARRCIVNLFWSWPILVL